MAVVVATAALAVVVAWGTTVGALSNGTVIGVTLFWLVLFGSLFLVSFLPAPFPSPSGLLPLLRTTLRGNFDPERVAVVVGVLLAVAAAGGGVGVVGYSKKDV